MYGLRTAGDIKLKMSFWVVPFRVAQMMVKLTAKWRNEQTIRTQLPDEDFPTVRSFTKLRYQTSYCVFYPNDIWKNSIDC